MSSPSRTMKSLLAVGSLAVLEACSNAGYYTQHGDGTMRAHTPLDAEAVVGPEMRGNGEPRAATTDFSIPGTLRTPPRPAAPAPVAPAASSPR